MIILKITNVVIIINQYNNISNYKHCNNYDYYNCITNYEYCHNYNRYNNINNIRSHFIIMIITGIIFIV